LEDEEKRGGWRKELKENFMLCQRLALLGRICQTKCTGRNINIGKMKNAYKSAVRKFETKKSLGRTRR
jgi:hypothetical protein